MTCQPGSRLAASNQSFTTVAAVVVISIGCIVLVGWALDIASLKSVLPGLVTMKANTALGFVLSGTSLLLAAKPVAHKIRLIGQLCTLAVIGLGLTTLSQYLFGWNLGLDQLLFADDPQPVGTSNPGRMSPLTASSFALVGFALWLVGATRTAASQAHLTQFLTLSASLICTQALIAYLYHVRPIIGLVAYTQMAVHTAVSFLVLCAGLLFAHPNQGLMRVVTANSVGGVIARSLLPAAIGIPLLLGWLKVTSERIGLFESTFGTSLLVVINIVVFVVLIWRNAQLLHQIDIQRQKAQKALNRANDELEFKVSERTTELREANLRLQSEVRERERAETAVRVSQQQLEAILDNAPAIIYVKNLQGRFTFINRQFETSFGVEREHCKLKTDYDLFPQESADRFRANDHKVLEVGEPLQWEEVAPQEDGLHTYISNKFPLFDSNGRPYAMCGISTDITERKRAEEALRKAHDELEMRVEERTVELKEANRFLEQEITERKQVDEKFRILFEESSDAHLLLDEGGVIDCNNAAISMLGCTDKAQLLSLHPAVLSPEYQPDGRRSDEKCIEMDRLAREQGFHRFEWMHRNIDDENFPVEVTLTPVMLHGKPVLLVVLHDLTKRKQVELELQKAKEAAEASTRAKSEFLATMSHEIRTPMNGVIGMTGLLLDTKLTPQQQDFVETIRSSGDALLAIINDILDFSKIESGKLDLELQTFDLRACIEEALDLVALKAVEKSLELAYLIAPPTPNRIVGDVTRLRQILVNLLSNAVKFTPAGEVVVSVTAQKLESEAEQCPSSPTPYSPLPTPYPRYELQFAVKDTGIGIPTDRMERLFKSFSQVDSSTSRQYGGTGLGLAISKRLSEIMGGRMWVESQVGHGSTFYFTVVVESVPGLLKVELDNCQTQLAGKRLLIVDDNATNREVLALLGQSWGMLTRAAESGFEALDWIHQGDTFDIAILDAIMPQMNGLTLAAAIRQQPEHQELPLIMLTEVGRQVSNVQAADVTAFLNKPIKQSQLYNVLLQTLGGQPSHLIQPHSTSHYDLQPETPQSQAEKVPLRILLAEDSLVNQKVALLVLQRIGYRADVAANGLEVLEALHRQTYDVVLMDVQMPEMDGLTATRRICQEWSHSLRPRIIAMTANAMQSDVQECLEVGMDDYISKPIRVEKLIQALSKCQPHA